MKFSKSCLWSSLELIPYVGYWRQDKTHMIAFGFLFWEFVFSWKGKWKVVGCFLRELIGVQFACYRFNIITTPKFHIALPHKMPYNGQRLGGEVSIQVLNLGIHI